MSHARDGSLLRKKQQQWARDKEDPTVTETWFPFGAPGCGSPNRPREDRAGSQPVDECKDAQLSPAARVISNSSSTENVAPGKDSCVPPCPAEMRGTNAGMNCSTVSHEASSTAPPQLPYAVPIQYPGGAAGAAPFMYPYAQAIPLEYLQQLQQSGQLLYPLSMPPPQQPGSLPIQPIQPIPMPFHLIPHGAIPIPNPNLPPADPSMCVWSGRSEEAPQETTILHAECEADREREGVRETIENVMPNSRLLEEQVYQEQAAEKRRLEAEAREMEDREMERIEGERAERERERVRAEEEQRDKERRKREESERNQELLLEAIEKAKREAEQMRKARVYKHVLETPWLAPEEEARLLGVDGEEEGERVMRMVDQFDRQRRKDMEELERAAPPRKGKEGRESGRSRAGTSGSEGSAAGSHRDAPPRSAGPTTVISFVYDDKEEEEDRGRRRSEQPEPRRPATQPAHRPPRGVSVDRTAAVPMTPVRPATVEATPPPRSVRQQSAPLVRDSRSRCSMRVRPSPRPNIVAPRRADSAERIDSAREKEEQRGQEQESMARSMGGESRRSRVDYNHMPHSVVEGTAPVPVSASATASAYAPAYASPASVTPAPASSHRTPSKSRLPVLRSSSQRRVPPSDREMMYGGGGGGGLMRSPSMGAGVMSSPTGRPPAAPIRRRPSVDAHTSRVIMSLPDDLPAPRTTRSRNNSFDLSEQNPLFAPIHTRSSRRMRHGGDMDRENQAAARSTGSTDGSECSADGEVEGVTGKGPVTTPVKVLAENNNDFVMRDHNTPERVRRSLDVCSPHLRPSSPANSLFLRKIAERNSRPQTPVEDVLSPDVRRRCELSAYPSMERLRASVSNLSINRLGGGVGGGDASPSPLSTGRESPSMDRFHSRSSQYRSLNLKKTSERQQKVLDRLAELRSQLKSRENYVERGSLSRHSSNISLVGRTQ